MLAHKTWTTGSFSSHSRSIENFLLNITCSGGTDTLKWYGLVLKVMEAEYAVVNTSSARFSTLAALSGYAIISNLNCFLDEGLKNEDVDVLVQVS